MLLIIYICVFIYYVCPMFFRFGIHYLCYMLYLTHCTHAAEVQERWENTTMFLTIVFGTGFLSSSPDSLSSSHMIVLSPILYLFYIHDIFNFTSQEQSPAAMIETKSLYIQTLKLLLTHLLLNIRMEQYCMFSEWKSMNWE